MFNESLFVFLASNFQYVPDWVQDQDLRTSFEECFQKYCQYDVQTSVTNTSSKSVEFLRELENEMTKSKLCNKFVVLPSSNEYILLRDERIKYEALVVISEPTVLIKTAYNGYNQLQITDGKFLSLDYINSAGLVSPHKMHSKMIGTTQKFVNGWLSRMTTDMGENKIIISKSKNNIVIEMTLKDCPDAFTITLIPCVEVRSGKYFVLLLFFMLYYIIDLVKITFTKYH